MMNKSYGKVAIIIPALNEEEALKRLLCNLTKDSYSNKEIIVVDGGSTDGTIEVAKRFGCRIIRQKEKSGPAGARNQGAKVAHAKFLTFCDADFNGYSEGYFLKVLRHFKNPKVAGVRTKYAFVVHNWFERLFLKQQYFHYPSFAGPFENTFSAAGAIQKKAFLETGGFAKFGVGEDIEFQHRFRTYCKKNNFVEVFEPDAIVYSNVPESFNEFAKSAMWHGRTMPIDIAKTGRSEFIRPPGIFISFVALVGFTMFHHPILLFFSIPFIFIALWFAWLAITRQDWEYIPALGLKLLYGVFFCIGLLQFLFGNRTNLGRT